MFKKFVVRCGIGLLMPMSFAVAAPGVADSQPMSKAEAESSSDIIEQLLNSVEKAKIDFQIVATTDPEKGFLLDALTVEGLFLFNSDWTADFTKDEDGKQLKKVIPNVHLDGKNLIAHAKVMATSDFMNIDLHFYDHFDANTGKLVPRPLTLVMGNAFNKSLITLKFLSVNAQITQSEVPGGKNKVKGTCATEKRLTDFVTFKSQVVPVKCEFEGYYTEKDGPKITFKYVNADPTTELKP